MVGKVLFLQKSLIDIPLMNIELRGWKIRNQIDNVPNKYKNNFLNFLFEYGYIQLWFENHRLDITTLRIPWLKNKGIINEIHINEINKYSDYIWRRLNDWKEKS